MKHVITKIQFAFHSVTIKLLNRLVKERRAPSKAEVVRDALAVFGWVHDHVKNGYRILAEKDGEFIEAVNPLIFPRRKSISRNAGERAPMFEDRSVKFDDDADDDDGRPELQTTTDGEKTGRL